MRDKISEFLVLILLVCVLLLVYQNKEKVTLFLVEKLYIKPVSEYSIYKEYSKNIDYLDFQQTTNYMPSDRQEMKNLLYTILDQGYEDFVFVCAKNYESCFDDATNDEILSIINNYVHPYNSYKVISMTPPDYFGIVNVTITKKYSELEINIINNKLDEITNQIINNNMNTEEKIRKFHDYIVNNTTYDSAKAELLEKNDTEGMISATAYNVLFKGSGICSEYTDTLAIFLNRINVNNFKVSTTNHIWNVININNNWKHIDITWDDPVSSKPMLIHDFFIIDNKRLEELDKNKDKHNFDHNLYLEIK